jgi:hypothetical protein
MVYLFSVDSVIHPLDHFPPRIFGFQMLKVQHCISTNTAGPSLIVDHLGCRLDTEITRCDTDASQGSHIQKVDETWQRPNSFVSLLCLQLSLSKGFVVFCCKSMGVRHLTDPSRCGFDSVA